MAKTRDIRNRIKSVRNTSQITRAMQLVSAAKMKKAQKAALEGRPYAQMMAEMLCQVAARLDPENISHPLLQIRETKTRGILLLSSDKGLCGALLANLWRKIASLEGPVKWVSVGRKGTQFLTRTHRELMADFSVSDTPTFAEIRPALDLLIEAFQEGEIDSVEVLYPRFINTLTQEPAIVRLAPLDSIEEIIKGFESVHDHTAEAPIANDERDIEFEPGLETILKELISLYIKREALQMTLEAKASEHSARMVAMKTATDNANKLVDGLTLQYNKVRQAAITQEILEITAAQMAETV